MKLNYINLLQRDILFDEELPSNTFNIEDYKPEDLQHVDGLKVIGYWKYPKPTPAGYTHGYQLENGHTTVWKQGDMHVKPIPKERWQGFDLPITEDSFGGVYHNFDHIKPNRGGNTQ